MCRSFASAVVLLGVVLAGLIAPGAAAAAPTTPAECSLHAGHYTAGPSVKPPITLTPDPATQTVNFGGSRGYKIVSVTLTASRPLPKSFKPDQLDIDVLRQLTRQSDSLTTVTLDSPTFSRPRLDPHRDLITFSICLNGAGIAAGHYTGVVRVEGPPGVGPASVALAANAQNTELFWAISLFTGVAVLVLVIWRGAKAAQSTVATSVAQDVLDARDPNQPKASSTVGPDTTSKAVQATAPVVSRPAGSQFLRDPTFWIGTVASVIVAFAAGWAVQASNPSWGSDPITDGVVVMTAIFGAAGFRSLISTAAGK